MKLGEIIIVLITGSSLTLLGSIICAFISYWLNSYKNRQQKKENQVKIRSIIKVEIHILDQWLIKFANELEISKNENQIFDENFFRFTPQTRMQTLKLDIKQLSVLTSHELKVIATFQANLEYFESVIDLIKSDIKIEYKLISSRLSYLWDSAYKVVHEVQDRLDEDGFTNDPWRPKFPEDRGKEE